MGLSVSLLIAASFAILCTYYIGDKILVIDFSAYRPQNLKKAKLERLLAKKDTPLRNSKIRNDIKKAFERILNCPKLCRQYKKTLLDVAE